MNVKHCPHVSAVNSVRIVLLIQQLFHCAEARALACVRVCVCEHDRVHVDA